MAKEKKVKTKVNYMPLIVALVVLFLASLALNVVNWTQPCTGSAVKALSKDEATTKLLTALNDKILQNGAQATLVSSTEKDDLYEVQLSIQGQPLTAYVTMDGKYFFPQAIDLDNLDELLQQNTDDTTDTTTTSDLEIGDAPVLGNEDAPVTVIVFSDFSCPYCEASEGYNQQVIDYLKSRDASWEAPVPNLVKDYVDTGEVKIAFKYFPGHGTGEEAMQLAFCAQDQGKFWEVHDLYFENYESLQDIDKLVELAGSVGVDTTQLRECYDSGKYASRLTDDTAEGRAAGVSGTPAFVINGKLVVGAVSYNSFKASVDAALAAAQ